MEHEPLLAFFFEEIERNPRIRPTGTETFTETREDPDRDVQAGAALGTETSTHAKHEEGDQDYESELAAGTETFTRAKGEDGDQDRISDTFPDDSDAPGIWEATIL